MPMIWTAGNLIFLVGVGAAIAFLVGSEILDTLRWRAQRRALADKADPAGRAPWRASRLPAAALRRIAID